MATVKADGENIAEVLLEDGLAYSYAGGTKEDWCDSEIDGTSDSLSDTSGVQIINIDKQEEIVTIQNVSETGVDLSGWRLISKRGNQEYVLPEGFRLDSGDTMKVTAGRNAEHDPPDVLKWTGSYIWNNSDSDPGLLLNDQGKVMSRWED